MLLYDLFYNLFSQSYMCLCPQPTLAIEFKLSSIDGYFIEIFLFLNFLFRLHAFNYNLLLIFSSSAYQKKARPGEVDEKQVRHMLKNTKNFHGWSCVSYERFGGNLQFVRMR